MGGSGQLQSVINNQYPAVQKMCAKLSARSFPHTVCKWAHMSAHRSWGRTMWNCVSGLVAEIKRCEKAGATTAAVAMAYVCIDTMAFLALPTGLDKQGRTDFITWVDKYLQGHQEQPYQYRGIDVYGARCALLHAFGSEADYHQKYPEAKKFGYHDGGKHAYDPAQDEHLVIIGTASFINDVVQAVGTFAEVCKVDADLRARVESRLPVVLATFQVNLI